MTERPEERLVDAVKYAVVHDDYSPTLIPIARAMAEGYRVLRALADSWDEYAMTMEARARDIDDDAFAIKSPMLATAQRAKEDSYALRTALQALDSLDAP